MRETRGARKTRYMNPQVLESMRSLAGYVCSSLCCYLFSNKCARLEIFEPNVLIGLIEHIVVEI